MKLVVHCRTLNLAKTIVIGAFLNTIGRMKIIFTLFFAGGLLLSSMAVQSADSSEKRYITENLEITMRSGKGTQFQIVRMLRSGTPITLLDVDKKTGYAKVKTESGTEGWVLTRFLSRFPSSKNQLTKTS